MTPEEFRRFGHLLVDWVADYRARMADLPVMSTVAPGALRDALPRSPPSGPEPFENVLADLDRLILPGISHWQHPSFHGYFPSNGELSSVLGDYLSTGLGVIGLSWQSSPALTELEEVVTDWLRQMVGLSAAWSGVIQDTASTCTLVALICARERTSGYSLARGGMQGEAGALRVYASAQSHSSVEKAALLAGFGRDNVVSVPTDERYALRPAALAAAVKADLEAGHRPCAVVATSGTTATTAFDPLDSHRRGRARPRPVASRGRGHGRLRHDPARMPRPLAGRRGRRLAGLERAQVARGRVRLLLVLRA